MAHQFRLNIIAVIKNADTGKNASLQNQQQQIAHIACCGSSKYTGTLTMQQEILYQLQ
jgi:hypothetical protein